MHVDDRMNMYVIVCHRLPKCGTMKIYGIFNKQKKLSNECKPSQKEKLYESSQTNSSPDYFEGFKIH